MGRDARGSLSGRWYQINMAKIKTAQVNAWMTEPHGPLKEAGTLVTFRVSPVTNTERQAAHLTPVALPRWPCAGKRSRVRGKHTGLQVRHRGSTPSSIPHSRAFSRLHNLSWAVSSFVKMKVGYLLCRDDLRMKPNNTCEPQG